MRLQVRFAVEHGDMWLMSGRCLTHHYGAATFLELRVAAVCHTTNITVCAGSPGEANCRCHVCCCNRSLQVLASSLGGLLSERHWQQGSYSGDVVPALVGDACLSGALALAEIDMLLGTGTGARQRAFGAAPQK